ncbi:MAG: dephospho-CoA kinase [Thermoguttaceae bacterium]
MDRRPRLIGLVGGIASGKSHVAAAFERRGAVVLRADEIAHKLLDTPEVACALRQRFGESVFDGETVSRKKLAAKVFGESASCCDLAFLEASLHPRVTCVIQREIATAATRVPPPPLIVIDAPLLLEVGLVGLVDEVLFVDTPDSVRAERCEKRGWSREQLAAREARQWPLERKKMAADAVVDGTLTPDELDVRLAELV